MYEDGRVLNIERQVTERLGAVSRPVPTRVLLIDNRPSLATRKRALDTGACGCVERSLSQADLREHLLALASCARISCESE